jgi:hypothetical protein
MLIKVLSPQHTRELLAEVRMEIGSWNGVRILPSGLSSKSEFVVGYSPEGALALHNFAEHVTSWMPCGKWTLVQLDNSTSLSPSERFLLGGLLGVPKDELKWDGSRSRSFLLEDAGESGQVERKLAISNILFVLLLFCGHGYLVSSESGTGRYLAFQDSVIYFYGDSVDIAEAKSLLELLKGKSLKSPEWVMEYDSADFDE